MIKPKRKLLPNHLAETLRNLLLSAKRPIEINKLTEMAFADEEDVETVPMLKKLYIAAKEEESHFTVDEYPSYKMRTYRGVPAFTDSSRGIYYPRAAAKVLLETKEYVDLMEIVGIIEREKLYKFPVLYPEYWMYQYLNEYKEIFARKGDLKIGLKDWQSIQPAKTKVPLDEITTKIHEANLESILIENLEIIETGLRLIQRQYVCPGVGRIDLLCEDKKHNLVVVELKKFGVKQDSIIDQIARYMGWVKSHVAKPRQQVRGIIVVALVDEKLKYAVSVFPNITVKTFDITIR